MGWSASTRSETIESIVRECISVMGEDSTTGASSLECGDVTVTVRRQRNGYCTVDLEPELTLGGSIDDANARSVGPARWVRTAETGVSKVRLDVPPRASLTMTRRGVGNALERAGWRGRVANEAVAAERFRRDRGKLTRSLQRLGVDPAALLRMGGGVLVGYASTVRGWELSESVGSGSYSNSTYCHLSLVADDQRTTWLRAAGVVGSAEHGEVHEMSSEDGLFSVRHVFADLDRRDTRRRRPVLAVADLALADVTPQRLGELVWSVVTYIDWQAAGSWQHGLDAVDGLVTEPEPPSEEPLELADWSRPPAMLVPVQPGVTHGHGGSESGDFERAEQLLRESFFRDGDEAVEDAWDLDFDVEGFFDDEPHTGGDEAEPGEDLHGGERCHLKGDGPSLCTSCAAAMEERGSDLLDRLTAIGAVSAAQHRELSMYLQHRSDQPRERQAVARLAVTAAKHMPRIDFTSLDHDQLLDELAARIGRDNPAYRAGAEILEMLVGEGRNDAVLLTGPAGLGKTMVAEAVASIIGIGSHLAQLGSAAGRFVIAGSDLEFREPDHGALVAGFVQFGTPQFMLVLDEIEKLAGLLGDVYPLAAVLSLLDDQRSSYTDRFVGSGSMWSIDATDTVFIGTANELGLVPDPLQSRMRVIHMPAWTRDEKLALARRQADDIVAELGLDQRIADDVLEAFVDECPQAGVRELLRVLDRYRSQLTRRGSLGSVDPLGFFPEPPATAVLTSAVPPAPAVGEVRTVVMTASGWHEVRCSATPNGSRWAGSLSALQNDGDAFELHWVPELEAALGISIPRCTLHVDPVPNAVTSPAGLSVAMLAAVVSAAVGRAPDGSVVAPVRATPGGAVLDCGFSVADLAGLAGAGFTKVVLARDPSFSLIEQRRTDVPTIVPASSLSAALDLLVPGLLEPLDARSGPGISGYL